MKIHNLLKIDSHKLSVVTPISFNDAGNIAFYDIVVDGVTITITHTSSNEENKTMLTFILNNDKIYSKWFDGTLSLSDFMKEHDNIHCMNED